MDTYSISLIELDLQLKEAAAEGDMDSMMDIMNSMGILLLTDRY